MLTCRGGGGAYADDVADFGTPKVYYVVQMTTRFSSMQEVMRAAPEQLAAHVARSGEFHDRGELLMAGAFLDNGDDPVSTMGVLVTRAAAEQFAEGDPFVLIGMISEWRIREWSNIFA